MRAERPSITRAKVVLRAQYQVSCQTLYGTADPKDVGIGVNAVEAVQHAIVKLALDNAGVAYTPRAPGLHTKPGVPPSHSGSTVPNHSTKGHMAQRQLVDAQLPHQSTQL